MALWRNLRRSSLVKITDAVEISSLGFKPEFIDTSEIYSLVERKSSIIGTDQ